MSHRGGAASRAVVAVATVLAATGAVLPAAAPAAARAATPAARCTAGHGVSVVVEHHRLGGPDLHRCDPGGGGLTATRILERQGLTVAYVQRMPGFLCRLDGMPAQDPCVNTPPDDAYWSLWWSDGSAPRWRYASAGVDSLEIPDGGSLALTWDGVAGDVAPTTPPGAPSATPSAGPSAAAGRTTSTASATSASPHRAGAATGAGLPVWVAPSAVGLLLALAAGLAAARRRRTGPST